MNTSVAAASQRAEQLAATLPPLLVAAERIAATVAQGVHGRRRVGQGDTFWQFRRYQPGDAASKIDWRQSAKTQPLFVREMEWAAAQSVWLWRDASGSMRWHSKAQWPEKRERADLLILALVALLVRGGERVALMGADMLPATGRATLNHIALMLERSDANAPSLPPDMPLPRHAHVVLASDFLSPLADIDAAVRRIAAQGVNGHLLQLLDPAEQTLPFTGRIRFAGLEAEGETLLSRVEAVRDAYVERLQAQIDGVAAIARAVGWTFSGHRTDRPPQTALLALYLQLSESARR